MKRVIGTCVHAAPCLRPHFIPAQRAGKGSKGVGVRYERLLAKALRPAVHGQWFQYVDDSGPNWCQPDLLVLGHKRTLVLECKLTFTLDAHEQIEKLYRPVLTQAYGKSVLGIIVCKNLVCSMPGEIIVDSYQEAIEVAEKTRKIPVLHWLGRGPV